MWYRQLSIRVTQSLCVSLFSWTGARAGSLELTKQQLIGSDLQVAATRQDQEDLRVVDWQQHTARREDDHDDMEQINPLGLREREEARRMVFKKRTILVFQELGPFYAQDQTQHKSRNLLGSGGPTQLQWARAAAVCAPTPALTSLSSGGCCTVSAAAFRAGMMLLSGILHGREVPPCALRRVAPAIGQRRDTAIRPLRRSGTMGWHRSDPHPTTHPHSPSRACGERVVGVEGRGSFMGSFISITHPLNNPSTLSSHPAKINTDRRLHYYISGKKSHDLKFC